MKEILFIFLTSVILDYCSDILTSKENKIKIFIKIGYLLRMSKNIMYTVSVVYCCKGFVELFDVILIIVSVLIIKLYGLLRIYFKTNQIQYYKEDEKEKINKPEVKNNFKIKNQ